LFLHALSRRRFAYLGTSTKNLPFGFLAAYVLGLVFPVRSTTRASPAGRAFFLSVIAEDRDLRPRDGTVPFRVAFRPLRTSLLRSAQQRHLVLPIPPSARSSFPMHGSAFTAWASLPFSFRLRIATSTPRASDVRFFCGRLLYPICSLTVHPKRSRCRGSKRSAFAALPPYPVLLAGLFSRRTDSLGLVRA